MSQALLQKFQNGQASALIAVIVCAMLSILAINFVWIRAIGVALYARVKRVSSQGLTREQVFFRTQLGLYIVSLLLGSLLSNIGYAINITWVSLGGIQQGAMTQIGDTASAYFTAAIAVHTFCTLALRSRLPPWLAYFAILLGWLLILAAGVIPAVLPVSTGPIYGTDGSVCGISLQYPIVQTLLHLVPIFLAALVSAVFYSLIFLILRGTLSIKGGLKFTLDPIERWSAQIGTVEYHKFIGAIAQSMLWYPIAYVLFILPHIIVCLLETSGFAAPFAVKVFAIACSALNGVTNVLIFYNTLRVMGPAFTNSSSKSDDAEKSFGTRENSSPVDVAPSVSVVLAHRAFPPPRSMTSPTHSRDTSVISMSGDSTRHLLPPRPAHGRSGSATTASSMQRSITPLSNLERLSSVRSSSSTGSGLPAPRRERRSPVIRRPTMTIEVPSRDDDPLTPINLQTPAPGTNTARRARNSFMKMYGSNSAVIYDDKAQRLTFGGDDIHSASLSRSAGSPSYSSSSSDFSSSAAISDNDVPLSPFMGELVRRTSQATRSPTHQRSASELRTPAGGMSSLAVATLKRNEMAAGNSPSRLKASRRRSKSMEALKPAAPPRPPRPNTPTAPRTGSLYSTADVTSPLSAVMNRAPSTPRSARAPIATLHNVPSRTPTVRTAIPHPEGRGYF
ncbi:unnamed protein product [Somion occarium]|uniref:G-protein coupled receptors family 1 profile domain-containing protein n=1 Tax=Somion occarium TaxID=3059160 RepID=A0ABP1E7K6_9APHY